MPCRLFYDSSLNHIIISEYRRFNKVSGQRGGKSNKSEGANC